MSCSASTISSDWAIPRSSAGFTGYAGEGGSTGPSGSLLLCVNNTAIPCKIEGLTTQKFISFTVINIRRKGWIKAPWKKAPSGKSSKVAFDDTAKHLFEDGEWARNDVTMERVERSVVVYSFIKDGQARGERVDESVSRIASGQTMRVRLHDFMFEDKKGGLNVFPSDVDVIPPFSVVEIMVNPSNSKGFDEGWGISIVRIRQCPFSLFSMQSPLGLGLLPSTYEESVTQAENHVQTNQGLRKVLEDKNTGFYGHVTKGSYIVKYNEDFRLVGPKEDPLDPQSRHLHVIAGGVFMIDISKDDLLRFANAAEAEQDDGLVYAQFMVEFAAAAGALDCYVTYNEYLQRNDPNRSPFIGVPLIDSQRLLEFIPTASITGAPGQRFHLPFDFSPMDQPFIALTPVPEDSARSSGDEPRPCGDFALTSENAHLGGDMSYSLSLGDATDENIMSFLFVPKRSAGGANKMLHGRRDYRLVKRQKTESGAT